MESTYCYIAWCTSVPCLWSIFYRKNFVGAPFWLRVLFIQSILLQMMNWNSFSFPKELELNMSVLDSCIMFVGASVLAPLLVYQCSIPAVQFFFPFHVSLTFFCSCINQIQCDLAAWTLVAWLAEHLLTFVLLLIVFPWLCDTSCLSELCLENHVFMLVPIVVSTNQNYSSGF